MLETKTHQMRGSSIPDRTDDLADLDFRHVWHPFTPMRQWRESEPTIIERADGFRLFDTRGRSYIDGFSSLWCNVHGHRVPEVDRAIRDQIDRVAHSTLLGLGNVPSIELAARLAAIAPGDLRSPDTKVFYSDSGATALEVAFKMALGRHYHSGEPHRDTFVALTGAYHGDTFGSMSVGYSETMHRAFERLTFACARTPAPDITHAPEADQRTDRSRWPGLDEELARRVKTRAIAELDRVLDEVGDRCAGIVVEPIMQGAAGMIAHPPGYLRDLARRARSRGILLIADEVAVGFGRVGTMFACEVEGVSPDILCLAKGISAGYLPLAATLCRDEIARSFEGEPSENRTLYHGHTYTGNPLACAAAIASLDLFEQNDVLSNAERLGARIGHALKTELSDHPHIGDVRRRGVMVGIELVARRDPWTPLDPARRTAAAVCMAARRAGLMIRPLGDVIILNPAPAMDEQTAEELLRILITTIRGFDFRPFLS